MLAATIGASSMVFIDGTLVNVALPALQRDLAATFSDVQWVVEAYALLLAALLLVGGAAGDRYGRRRVFAIGIALFAAASIGCGFAGNVAQLIAARALQGVGGALLVPGSLAIISASFDPGDRGKAIGTWSAATALTTALGPVIGGWLIDHGSWRAAFLLNVPLALAVLALTARHVRESRHDGDSGPVDWAGALLTTAGLGAIVYGLIESPTRGMRDLRVLASVVAGVIALACFVVIERRHASPMIPLQLFRVRAFTGANVLTLLLYAALGGSLFFVPLDLIEVHHYSATAAGAALLPLVVLLAALSRWSGGLVDRHGARLPLVAGPSIAACGFALLAVPGTGGSYWTSFFPPIVVLGVGLGITVAPLTTIVMNAVPQDFVGAASGINNAASRVAGLLAVAVFGVIMLPIFERALDQGLERAHVAPAAAQALARQRGRLAAVELPAMLDARDKAAAERAVADAFVSGFRAIMLVSAALALAGAASGWLAVDTAAATPRGPAALS